MALVMPPHPFPILGDGFGGSGGLGKAPMPLFPSSRQDLGVQVALVKPHPFPILRTGFRGSGALGKALSPFSILGEGFRGSKGKASPPFPIIRAGFGGSGGPEPVKPQSHPQDLGAQVTQVKPHSFTTLRTGFRGSDGLDKAPSSFSHPRDRI